MLNWWAVFLAFLIANGHVVINEYSTHISGVLNERWYYLNAIIVTFIQIRKCFLFDYFLYWKKEKFFNFYYTHKNLAICTWFL